MRRSSSKRRSERPAAATISELDDSILESQIDVLNNEAPLLDADHPTAQVCENASLRFVIITSVSEFRRRRGPIVKKLGARPRSKITGSLDGIRKERDERFRCG